MATIQKRKSSKGVVSWVAQVRIRPFKPVAKFFPSRRAAVEWAEAHQRMLREQRRRNDSPPPELPTLTVAQLATAFLSEPETASLRSYDSLEPLVLWWVNQYGTTRVLALGPLKLREARDKLRAGRAPATVNRYLSAMRACWNWGRAAGYVPQDLIWPQRLLLTEPKGRTRFLSDEELERLLEVARQDVQQFYTAVLLSIACGMRRSELLRLTWADIDFERQRVSILQTKNNESRSVYLPPAAADALRAVKALPVAGRHVFLTTNATPCTQEWLHHHWRTARAAARLKDFRWHDLRHSCASYLAQNGANLLEIGAVLGHKSPSVTQRYSHLVQGAPVTGHSKLNDKLRGRT